ncbi:HAD family hydrolase [Verticiella sediminum]|uniref:D,D-heptose 1,7-bisphosphate phosphatase n=2 Tax=Verticiella sediminum TaxID=1247510 RepID=A0A556AFF5_9BURK|nr:HAD family hydrolase [Verticiella sediminum]
MNPAAEDAGCEPAGAVFLDKDGTLLEDVPYNVDPARMRFAPGVPSGLRRLAALGVPLVVVSNQPGLALGLFEEAALQAMQSHLRRMFADAGAALTAFYYCPHHPDGTVAPFACACRCRKPDSGMLERAAREHGLSLARSWLIGDILDDVEAGRRAGCRTVLLDNGNETQWRPGALRVPQHMAADFDEAASYVAQWMAARSRSHA